MKHQKRTFKEDRHFHNSFTDYSKDFTDYYIVNKQEDGEVAYSLGIWTGSGYYVARFLCFADNIYEAIDRTFDYCDEKYKGQFVFDLKEVEEAAKEGIDMYDEYDEIADMEEELDNTKKELEELQDKYSDHVYNLNNWEDYRKAERRMDKLEVEIDELEEKINGLKGELIDRYVSDNYVEDSNYTLFAYADNFRIDETPKEIADEILSQNAENLEESRRFIINRENKLFNEGRRDEMIAVKWDDDTFERLFPSSVSILHNPEEYEGSNDLFIQKYITKWLEYYYLCKNEDDVFVSFKLFIKRHDDDLLNLDSVIDEFEKIFNKFDRKTRKEIIEKYDSVDSWIDEMLKKYFLYCEGYNEVIPLEDKIDELKKMSNYFTAQLHKITSAVRSVSKIKDSDLQLILQNKTGYYKESKRKLPNKRLIERNEKKAQKMRELDSLVCESSNGIFKNEEIKKYADVIIKKFGDIEDFEDFYNNVSDWMSSFGDISEKALAEEYFYEVDELENDDETYRQAIDTFIEDVYNTSRKKDAKSLV